MSKTDKSKFLAFVLRHNPDSIGITLDANGWVEIETLLEKTAKSKGYNYLSRSILEDIVSNDSKGRYVIQGDRIRAVHGHSVNVETGTVTVPPDMLYHGTATRFVEAIRTEGLKKQSRQHVHLSADEATAIEVGKRHGKLVLLIVDTKKMHEDGFIFKISDSGVWLTDHVPPQYLKDA